MSEKRNNKSVPSENYLKITVSENKIKLLDLWQ